MNMGPSDGREAVCLSLNPCLHTVRDLASHWAVW